MSVPDPDLAQAALDFKKGGWIVSLLGVAGALIKMLLSEHEYSWVVWVKRAIAGGLTGVIVYFALHGSDIDQLYKSIILSSSGAVAPMLFQALEDKIKSLLKLKK